ncbi:cobyric acid synthase CobQ [Methanothermococcus okinawensis]|uniref:Probable cobyric acid synthase n=1 Tax=Methanothermococcus okinawensis (strain DSM 14208 / JCM 11175 / IH1) TaxID=647113 RepID=F8AKI1_METOI|nr:cobyric acid synthase CobQ [Methanothermococcus okinawensis]AEH07507.1 Cobyric acid synthase [Methanothermococcus okinawensis IH1]
MAKFIMVVGTSSNSGKTVMVSGLCRALANRGYKVAPFKSQNMSLNSRVAKEDGEIAVAQYTQSLAAKTEPSIHFNPVLLKPKGNFTSQVIVQGKPYKNMDYNEYRKNKAYFLNKIKESLDYLDKNYDYVVMEGAGSCCEINLLDDDIANLRIAEMSNANAILISDIDRGGVFASIYGTVELLPKKWRKLIKGFVINKFRGNIDVLKNGFEKIEELTNIPVLGVIPYDDSLILPEEDSQALQNRRVFGDIKSSVEVDVLKFSKISNFTDVDTLSKDAVVKFIDFKDDITGDILILPGTRCSTVEMQLMKKYGMNKKILEFVKNGGIVLGICGGYQTMGVKLIDEENTEGNIKSIEGLGLFDMETHFGNEKAIKNSEGILEVDGLKFKVSGYELHEGITISNEKPLIKLIKGFGNDGNGFDGAIKIIEHKKDKKEDANHGNNTINDNTNIIDKSYIFGTYLHGILDNYQFRNYLVNLVRVKKGLNPITTDNYGNTFEENMDKLAKIIEENIDLEKII